MAYADFGSYLEEETNLQEINRGLKNILREMKELSDDEDSKSVDKKLASVLPKTEEIHQPTSPLPAVEHFEENKHQPQNRRIRPSEPRVDSNLYEDYFPCVVMMQVLFCNTCHMYFFAVINSYKQRIGHPWAFIDSDVFILFFPCSFSLVIERSRGSNPTCIGDIEKPIRNLLSEHREFNEENFDTMIQNFEKNWDKLGIDESSRVELRVRNFRKDDMNKMYVKYSFPLFFLGLRWVWKSEKTRQEVDGKTLAYDQNRHLPDRYHVTLGA